MGQQERVFARLGPLTAIAALDPLVAVSPQLDITPVVTEPLDEA